MNFNRLTHLGKAALIVITAGVVSVVGVGSSVAVKEHAKLKQLEQNPYVVTVVVTATPTATPSATLVPTVKHFVPVVTKPLALPSK